MIVITYTENKNIYLNQSWSYAYTVCCKSWPPATSTVPSSRTRHLPVYARS